MEKQYRMCNRCVMDTTTQFISFDENGYCNYCTSAIEEYKKRTYWGREKEKEEALIKIKEEIKASSVGKKYDCIIGLSGGLDSSYLAYYVVKKLGLNPLAIHIDNGWDSELAVKNIANIVQKLNIDLYTYVINWEEFKALQKAYLRASVVDLEVLSDNPIIVIISRMAKKYKIKYFLFGSNIATESVMPPDWYYQYKNDALNIKAIYKKYGDNIKLKTYPLAGFFEYIFLFRNLKSVSLLNLIDYNKDEAKRIMKEELGWRDYGEKHHESFITKFYQNYILPTKFNIDKRKAHLSSLIVSGQITREEALKELAKPLYKSENELKNDIEYFLKKLELSKEEFDEIMKAPRREHLEFPSYIKIIKFLKNNSIMTKLRKS